MRFMEIANPEDQLALWKLVSDKVWDTFAQQVGQPDSTESKPASTPQVKAPEQLVANAPNANTQNRTQKKISSKVARKGRGKGKGRAIKPKRAPMAPPPKPLPSPKPLPPTQTQTKQAQTQQHQQLAHHIQQALTKKPPAPSTPQPIQPRGPITNTVAPMNNSYSERDKDELVFHRRENPLKPLRDQKPL